MNNYSANRRFAWRIITIQSIALVTLSMFCLVLWGTVSALSAIAGGGIAIAAALLMTLRVFGLPLGKVKALTPQDFARRIYQGEALKFVVTLAGFILAFVTAEPQPAALFAGYVLVLLLNWLALLMGQELKDAN